MQNLEINQTDSGIIFKTKIVPASSKNAVMGTLGGMLKIKISAAPEKGKANQCLIEFLSDFLDVKKKDIQIISGQTSPTKEIKITNLNKITFCEKLGLK